jgi:hypothetical protein
MRHLTTALTTRSDPRVKFINDPQLVLVELNFRDHLPDALINAADRPREGRHA